MSGCCEVKDLRKIRVGDDVVGLTGVNMILRTLYVEGRSAEDADLGKTFVERLRKLGNYIPADENRSTLRS